MSSCFPSVTGPAYAPFLTGRYPASIGLPGLRWFDRARTRCTAPDYCRSYVGYQLSRLDGDLAPDSPTVFELTARPLGAVSLITRGLSNDQQVGRLTPRTAFRAAVAHFTGNVQRAFANDRELARRSVRQLREQRPDFAFLAFGTPDKSAHAFGHDSATVVEALQLIDGVVATIREDAERDGRWDSMHLWLVSDHGHSPVREHDELADVLRAMNLRTLAHPWTLTTHADVALMVSGNAMAHIYLDPRRPDRHVWPDVDRRWAALTDALAARPSVDLVILPTRDGALVRSADRGESIVTARDGRFDYRCVSGDPLGLGRDLRGLDEADAYCATLTTDYPDGIVQIAAIAASPRAGEIILSAARDWDFRRRHEPIAHVSSHGALHREHMLVPFLTNRPQALSRRPRRTVDVMPSALAVLGRPIPHGLDGVSFVDTFPS